MSKTIAVDHPCSPEKVVDVRWWTDELLSFRVTKPLALRYLPGQYARIALQVGNQLIWRPFSFVSSPAGELLEFLAVLVPGGLFTDQLRHIDAGDTLWVEHENYGFMTPDRFEGGSDLWLLATGTGVGAFLSVLRDSAVWLQYQQIVMVHGVRTRSQLVYRDELVDMQIQTRHQKHGAQLSLLACVSGENIPPSTTDIQTDYRYLSTRMSTAFDSGQLESSAGIRISTENSRIMLCGNPAMIEDMRKRLHLRGLTPCRKQKPGQFLTENYW